MEKKYLIDELKKNGFRITKQREMLLDIILENIVILKPFFFNSSIKYFFSIYSGN